MDSSRGHRSFRLLGVLCMVGGLCSWGALGWGALKELDRVTPESDVGGRLLAWGLVGTVLMIAGLAFLQIAARAEESAEAPRP